MIERTYNVRQAVLGMSSSYPAVGNAAEGFWNMREAEIGSG